MKKIFLAFTATSALLLAAFTTAQTQSTDAVASAKTGKSSAELFAFNSTAASNSTKASKMASRAAKNFQKSFKNVANADWTVTEDGGFIASFNDDGVKTSVVYNDHGHWMHSIKRYSDKQLPKSIVQTVKSSYYDYNIICGEEIHVNTQVIFLVHIQTERNSKTLRITDEDMEVIEDLSN